MFSSNLEFHADYKLKICCNFFLNEYVNTMFPVTTIFPSAPFPSHRFRRTLCGSLPSPIHAICSTQFIVLPKYTEFLLSLISQGCLYGKFINSKIGKKE